MSTDQPAFVAPGTPIDLDNCDREPLHWAGAIQPHGALVACAPDAPHAIRRRAGALGAGVATLTELAGTAQAQTLLAAARAPGPPHLRPLRLAPDGALPGPTDATAYLTPEDELVVELEPAAPTPEPERSTATVAVLAGATSTGDLLERAIGELRRLTGFDRVWAYRFESDGHGVVVAEDAAEGLESFLGLHYPASDIPPQARALFLRNAVRVIADVAADPLPVVPLTDPDTGAWLDLSDSGLRAVSPMHLRYLGEMGVRASMSVALVVEGELWGLLSAHHYAGPMRPSPVTRAQAALLGQVTSLQLTVLRDLADARERLGLDAAADRVLAVVADAPSVLDGLVAAPDDLRAIAAADGALVSVGGTVTGVGAVPADTAALLDLLEREADDEGRVALDDVPHHEGGAALGPSATGVLAVALSRARREWLVWLRGPWEQEVTWAHRDQELVRRSLGGDLALGPRESYERWSAGAAGHARPWSAAERAAADAFRRALGTFVIARAEQLAELNDELERSNDELEAFAFAAAHDLQEPLRGIHSFASFLLEDHGEALGDDGRELAETIQKLSRRSSGLLQALLDYARVSRSAMVLADVSLVSAVDDVRSLLHRRIAEVGGEVTVVADTTVHLDPDHLEQVLLNLVSNALKYGGDRPSVRVGGEPLAEGGTLLFVEDDGIGIAPEHQETIFAVFRRLHARDQFGGGSGAGLAIVKRIAERYEGSVAVRSALGEGARFEVRLPGAPA